MKEHLVANYIVQNFKRSTSIHQQSPSTQNGKESSAIGTLFRIDWKDQIFLSEPYTLALDKLQ